METYHALTPVAPSRQPPGQISEHAITPANPPKAEEPEPTQPDQQPAPIVN